MPEKFILEKIRSVRRRLNMQRCFQTLAQFLFYGLLLCVPLFIIDSLTTFNVSPLILLWLTLGISAAALIMIALRPASLYEAAREIDTAASLKDRTVSALEFIQRPPGEALTELQIRDTFNHLQSIPTKQVAHYAVPRETKFVLLIALVLLAFSYVEFFAPSATSTEIDYSPQIAAEAEPLLKQIEEAKKEAQKINDQELEEILKQIEAKALELKKAKVTPKEALAKLTELSTMLKSKMDSAKMAKVESLMKGLGQQFTGNPILGDFGYTLKRGEYEQAAKKLDKVKENIKQLNREQRQNLSDELKRGGKSLEDTDLDALGTELARAGASLEEDDLEGTQVRLRKGSRRLLDLAFEKRRNLSLAKLLSQCEISKVGIRKACNSNAISNLEGLARKTNSPSNSAGKATDPNPFGEMTAIDSALQLERITGIQSEGPSSVRISKTSEKGQQSTVSYKEVYTKYQKLSEEALSQEQIPLGYKFYVKRYFESIRPED